jgi:hypothetical protein
MGRFIEDAEGNLINLDRVRSIRKRRNEKDTYVLWEEDGELGEVYSYQLDELTGTMIPAQAGATAFVVFAWWDGETEQYESLVEEHPVVAWHVRGIGTSPVMPSRPSYQASGTVVISMPGGRFAMEWDEILDSIDEVKERVIDRKRRDDKWKSEHEERKRQEVEKQAS